MINWLQNGQTIALVSDAGTPAISDPGEELVQAAIAGNIPVCVFARAHRTDYSFNSFGASGKPFCFYGFTTAGKEKKAYWQKYWRKIKL